MSLLSDISIRSALLLNHSSTWVKSRTSDKMGKITPDINTAASSHSASVRVALHWSAAAANASSYRKTSRESGLSGSPDPTWQHVVTASKPIEDLLETGESQTSRKALRTFDGFRNPQVRVCPCLYAEDGKGHPTSKVILIKRPSGRFPHLMMDLDAKAWVCFITIPGCLTSSSDYTFFHNISSH